MEFSTRTRSSMHSARACDNDKKVAEGRDEYWHFYLPCTKSKKIYSRQLLQDLRSDALSFFDVHHKNGKSKNCVVDLEVIFVGLY